MPREADGGAKSRRDTNRRSRRSWGHRLRVRADTAPRTETTAAMKQAAASRGPGAHWVGGDGPGGRQARRPRNPRGDSVGPVGPVVTLRKEGVRHPFPSQRGKRAQATGDGGRTSGQREARSPCRGRGQVVMPRSSGDQARGLRWPIARWGPLRLRRVIGAHARTGSCFVSGLSGVHTVAWRRSSALMPGYFRRGPRIRAVGGGSRGHSCRSSSSERVARPTTTAAQAEAGGATVLRQIPERRQGERPCAPLSGTRWSRGRGWPSHASDRRWSGTTRARIPLFLGRGSKRPAGPSSSSGPGAWDFHSMPPRAADVETKHARRPEAFSAAVGDARSRTKTSRAIDLIGRQLMAAPPRC